MNFNSTKDTYIQILNEVEKVLGETRKTCFYCIYNGSLYVGCNKRRSNSIFNALSNVLGLKQVKVSYTEDTYIYDFVA